jgi:hypothetical protein
MIYYRYYLWYYFCLMIEGSGSILWTREDKKHVDPVDLDSDPEHCCKVYRRYCTISAIKNFKTK